MSLGEQFPDVTHNAVGLPADSGAAGLNPRFFCT